MEKQYEKLKILSRLALALSILLFAAMLINIAWEAFKLSTILSSAPVYSSILVGIYYLPFIIAAQVFYFIIRKKLPEHFPERKKEKPAKKSFASRLVRIGTLAVIILFLLLILAPFLAIPLYLNHHVSYTGTATLNHPLQDIYKASDFDLSEKQMYLKTEDNLKVWVSEIYTPNPKAVIIYLSGIEQPSVTYFYGHSRYMLEQGVASFLLEVRGHGKSDGKRICLGYEETKDVRAIVDYIRNNSAYDGVPIVLQGVSMGGASAINAFGQIDAIDGLIAMSPYSSFEDVTVSTMKRLGVPAFICAFEKPLITASLSLMYGKNTVSEQKPIKQIQSAENRPILLISCTGDTEVPTDNTLRLKAANPDIQIWIRDSWEHFIVKNCDFKNVAQDKEYWSKIMDFLQNNIY